MANQEVNETKSSVRSRTVFGLGWLFGTTMGVVATLTVIFNRTTLLKWRDWVADRVGWVIVFSVLILLLLVLIGIVLRLHRQLTNIQKRLDKVTSPQSARPQPFVIESKDVTVKEDTPPLTARRQARAGGKPIASS